ncbi:hypothetical protein P3T76_010438 [Phytophthora citrophthora]|uniref:Uncharacterized protein n=1 Tax=Phytophthora citrophthora TaxID=4793 RepID=A0AAD9GC14_9STRA|nr:hypothetical protein P3T76_010438 [Phytophthora citrophthora]
MLAPKTFAIAAVLALAQTQAENAAHIRVRVHAKVTCPSGQESIGVVGWSQDGCVTSGNVCVAQVDGDCPTGAHCDMLDTGVYGCKDGAEEAASTGCTGSEQTIGVVGWDHDGCINSSNVCVAQVSNGDCPSGASCQKLDTGVFGCVATSKHRHHKSHHKSVTCPSGQETIGVVGWSQDGCVASGNVCVAQVNGDCPSGAHCEMLDTGVYGCADGAATNETSSGTGCSGSEQTIGVVGWDHDGCIASSNVCVAQVSNGDCPEGAYCSLLDTGVYGCVASSRRHRHHKSHHKATATCPSGQESIAVAGWSQDGCVASGNVCVANTNGACPAGAHCAWLDTGVYGCKDGAGSSSWAGCSGSEQTIGVVGWEHDGCISSSNVCVAQVSNGDCPSGASCQKLSTGVYGCVGTGSSKRHHHHKSHHKSVTCPSGQESIGVVGWSQDGCVTSGNVCVAQVDGDCPTGAHCDMLDTGVYGCKDGAEEAASTGCTGSEQTIGVVGWDHDGCISSSNVCVAQVSNGDCPEGAYCSLLDTGVYGCVASSKH